MFVNIGNNIVLDVKNIIGIYDVETMSNSEEYRNLVNSLKRTKNFVSLIKQNPKALVMTNENGKIIGYETDMQAQTITMKTQEDNIRKEQF